MAGSISLRGKPVSHNHNMAQRQPEERWVMIPSHPMELRFHPENFKIQIILSSVAALYGFKNPRLEHLHELAVYVLVATNHVSRS